MPQEVDPHLRPSFASPSRESSPQGGSLPRHARWTSAASMSPTVTRHRSNIVDNSRPPPSARSEPLRPGSAVIEDRETVEGSASQRALRCASPSTARIPHAPPRRGVLAETRQTVLPTHLRQTIRVLEKNVAALSAFSAEFPGLSATETPAASTRLSALLRAQAAAVQDLTVYTQNEVCQAKVSIADLSTLVQSKKGGEQLGAAASVAAYRSLHTLIHTTATVLCCERAIVFLRRRHPRLRQAVAIPHASESAGLFDSPVAETGGPATAGTVPQTNGVSSQLQLVALVSSSPISSQNAPEVSPAVASVCESVAATASAVNLTYRTAPKGTALEERTVLAAPIRVPGATTGDCVGVVAFLGKLAHRPSSEASSHLGGSRRVLSNALQQAIDQTDRGAEGFLLSSFSADDEYRSAVVAEQLSVLLTSLPFGTVHTGSAAMSPSTFQREFAEYASDSASAPPTPPDVPPPCATGRVDYTDFEGAERSRAPHHDSKRRYILRTDVSGATLSRLLATPQRQTVTGAALLDDVAARLAYVEGKVLQMDAACGDQKRRTTEALRSLGEVKAELHVARRDAADMRFACDRLLRSAYVQPATAAGEVPRPLANGSTVDDAGGSPKRMARGSASSDATYVRSVLQQPSPSAGPENNATSAQRSPFGRPYSSSSRKR